ncbi:uncharacterized protein BcabD6B2_37820 [Babesia caballi]|uniref:Conserved Plasmodium protein homolog n=1 Tax=Babesia caballi TaxID=5871 RepID=A0AAV4LXH6_BABCB|nr:conserved Plasmodium protein homolog [Babesia caballi]
MFSRRVGVCARAAASQQRWALTRLTKDRNANTPLAVPDKKNDLGRYQYPSDPDALLVEGERLSRGERIYQRISIGALLLAAWHRFAGLPFIAFATALAIPVGLVTVFTMRKQRRRAEPLEPVARVEPAPEVTDALQSLSARDLAKLVHAKVPTLVVYFRPGGNDEEANRVNLLCALLKEVGALEGSGLKVYRVNVKEELQHFNPYLKEEVQRSPGTLLHLVIPTEGESHVMSVLPPASATSFVAQLARALGDFRVKFAKDEEAAGRIDEQVARIKRCMFDLKMEGQLRFVEGRSLRQLELQCNKLLASAGGPSHGKALGVEAEEHAAVVAVVLTRGQALRREAAAVLPVVNGVQGHAPLVQVLVLQPPPNVLEKRLVSAPERVEHHDAPRGGAHVDDAEAPVVPVRVHGHQQEVDGEDVDLAPGGPTGHGAVVVAGVGVVAAAEHVEKKGVEAEAARYSRDAVPHQAVVALLHQADEKVDDLVVEPVGAVEACQVLAGHFDAELVGQHLGGAAPAQAFQRLFGVSEKVEVEPAIGRVILE